MRISTINVPNLHFVRKGEYITKKGVIQGDLRGKFRKKALQISEEYGMITFVIMYFWRYAHGGLAETLEGAVL